MKSLLYYMAQRDLLLSLKQVDQSLIILLFIYLNNDGPKTFSYIISLQSK